MLLFSHRRLKTHETGLLGRVLFFGEELIITKGETRNSATLGAEWILVYRIYFKSLEYANLLGRKELYMGKSKLHGVVGLIVKLKLMERLLQMSHKWHSAFILEQHMTHAMEGTIPILQM